MRNRNKSVQWSFNQLEFFFKDIFNVLSAWKSEHPCTQQHTTLNGLYFSLTGWFSFVLNQIRRPLWLTSIDPSEVAQCYKRRETSQYRPYLFKGDINYHDTAEWHTPCAVASGGYAKYTLHQWWDVNKQSLVAWGCQDWNRIKPNVSAVEKSCFLSQCLDQTQSPSERRPWQWC